MHTYLINRDNCNSFTNPVYSANTEATNKEDITGYKDHVYNAIDHPEDMDEKDKVKPKSMASSTAYHNFLQNVNDNERASIKSDDVSCIQSVTENGEHYNKSKSLPKPRYTNDVIVAPVTDAQLTHKTLSADNVCTLQYPTFNDSLDASHAVNNEEYITQEFTHTTEKGSKEVAHITTDNDHQEIV